MSQKITNHPTKLIPALVLSCGALLCAAGWAEPSARRLNRDGIEAYRKNDYPKAEEQFEKAARQAPDNLLIHYNSGAAKASQDKLDEARKDFEEVSAARDRDLAARGSFAKGVVSYREAEKKGKEKDLQGALEQAKTAEEANKSVLRARPDDDDARVNLEMATQLRKEIQRQLQEQKDQQQQKDQQKQDQQKDQQKQDQEKQDPQKDQQKQDQEKQDPQKDQQKQDQQKQDQQQEQKEQEQKEREQAKEDQAKKEQEKQARERKAQEEKGKEEQSQPQDASQDKARQEQMDKDVTRSILNLLDENDVAALKRMMKERYGRAQHPQKDW